MTGANGIAQREIDNNEFILLEENKPEYFSLPAGVEAVVVRTPTERGWKVQFGFCDGYTGSSYVLTLEAVATVADGGEGVVWRLAGRHGIGADVAAEDDGLPCVRVIK